MADRTWGRCQRRDKDGKTALHFVAQDRKTPVEAIEGLTALGADIKAKYTGGKTAGKVAVIESLVAHDEADAKAAD
jgi:hypothetical protein